MASKVLFAPMAYSRYEANQTLPAKFDRLLKKTGTAAIADRIVYHKEALNIRQ